jgi:HipA-like protein
MSADDGLALEVLLDGQLAGHFWHDPARNQFAFRYAPSWLANPAAYPLGPGLPLAPEPDQDASAHSLGVRVRV